YERLRRSSRRMSFAGGRWIRRIGTIGPVSRLTQGLTRSPKLYAACIAGTWRRRTSALLTAWKAHKVYWQQDLPSHDRSGPPATLGGAQSSCWTHSASIWLES